MRPTILSLLALLTTTLSYGQNHDLAAAAAGIAGVTLGAIASIEAAAEEFEYHANNYILNTSDAQHYQLKLLDFDGKKLSDIGPQSVVSFSLKETVKDIESGGFSIRKKVIFMTGTPGWLSPTGLDVTKITWTVYDEAEWLTMFGQFIDMASPADIASMVNENQIDPGQIPSFSKASIKQCRDSEAPSFIITHAGSNQCYQYTGQSTPISFCQMNRKGIEKTSSMGSNEMILPFYKLGDDEYFVSSVNPSIKIIFNERALGIFDKRTGKSVQLQRSLVNKIMRFF